MDDTEVVVEARGIVRRYGERVAVDGLSFSVRRGEMFGLIGPDGAGKTTTLRMVLGLLKPDEGHLTACGLDPFAQARALSRRVGYLSQRFSLYGDLTVDENIAFFARVHGVRRSAPRREELLERLRLRPFGGRLADRLSGGMKQKLALACTLIHTPELLVLDEPTTGVDPVSRRDFWRILAQLQRDGLTLVLTTPYLDEAERCGRVALIDRGKLLSLDTPDALRDAVEVGIVEVIARPPARARDWLKRQPEVAEVVTFGERLHATLRVSRAGTAAAAERVREGLAAEGVEVQSVRPVRPSLEDVFIARLRASGAGPLEAGA